MIFLKLTFPIADIGNMDPFQRSEFFDHRQPIGHRLTRVIEIGEPVDNRNSGVLREFDEMVIHAVGDAVQERARKHVARAVGVHGGGGEGIDFVQAVAVIHQRMTLPCIIQVLLEFAPYLGFIFFPSNSKVLEELAPILG